MRLIAVGRLRRGPEADLFARYAARLRPGLALTEIAEGGGGDIEARRREGQAILAGNGTAHLKTLAGGELTLMMNGPTNIIVQDAKGQIADITIADVNQANGVIHVIDRVLLPG